MSWQALLKKPAPRDHIVQVYRERAFLVEAVAQYIGAGLAQGEAAIVIARPAHAAAFRSELERRHAAENGQLVMLDAEDTLAKFMVDGWPFWPAFRDTIGGLVRDLRERYSTVRAYGEMVDLLWQRGEHEAALCLEDYWNDLGKLEPFALFCAYRIDPLDVGVYGGALQSICKAHNHFIPARDYERLEAEVRKASSDVLKNESAMMLSLAASQAPATHMPAGQAMLFWLQSNLPCAAEKIFARVKKATSRP